jgi:hypothetical protein
MQSYGNNNLHITGRWSNIGAQTFNNYQYYVTWKSISRILIKQSTVSWILRVFSFRCFNWQNPAKLNYTLLESFWGDPFSNWNFFNSPKFPRLNITNIKSSFHDDFRRKYWRDGCQRTASGICCFVASIMVICNILLKGSFLRKFGNVNV